MVADILDLVFEKGIVPHDNHTQWISEGQRNGRKVYYIVHKDSTHRPSDIRKHFVCVEADVVRIDTHHHFSVIAVKLIRALPKIKPTKATSVQPPIDDPLFYAEDRRTRTRQGTNGFNGKPVA